MADAAKRAGYTKGIAKKEGPKALYELGAYHAAKNAGYVSPANVKNYLAALGKAEFATASAEQGGAVKGKTDARYELALKAQKAAQIQAALAALRQEELQAEADREQRRREYAESARQAYIENRVGADALSQRMAAMGYSGGKAKSAELALNTRYDQRLKQARESREAGDRQSELRVARAKIAAEGRMGEIEARYDAQAAQRLKTATAKKAAKTQDQNAGEGYFLEQLYRKNLAAAQSGRVSLRELTQNREMLLKYYGGSYATDAQVPPCRPVWYWPLPDNCLCPTRLTNLQTGAEMPVSLRENTLMLPFDRPGEYLLRYDGLPKAVAPGDPEETWLEVHPAAEQLLPLRVAADAALADQQSGGLGSFLEAKYGLMAAGAALALPGDGVEGRLATVYWGG